MEDVLHQMYAHSVTSLAQSHSANEFLLTDSSFGLLIFTMWRNFVIFFVLLSQAFGQPMANNGKWHLHLQCIRQSNWNSEGRNWLVSPSFKPRFFPLPLSDPQLTAQFLCEQSELSLMLSLRWQSFRSLRYHMRNCKLLRCEEHVK